MMIAVSKPLLLAAVAAIVALGLTALGVKPIRQAIAATQPYRQATLPQAPETGFFPGRCLSMGGLEHQPREGAWANGRPIQRNDFTVMKHGGFDTVRLIVDLERNVGDTPPYRLNEAYIRRVEEVVGWATAAGLNVILAPANQSSVHDDHARGGPKLLAVWRQLAPRWKDWPQTVAFAPLNEPHGALNGPQVSPYYAQLIATIRPTNPTRWLVISPPQWGTHWGLNELTLPKGDRRLIVDIHYYHPYQFTHSGAEWLPADRRPPAGRIWPRPGELNELDQHVTEMVAWSQRTGVPIYLGEFGVDDGLPLEARAAWSRAVRERLDAANIDWCYYSFTPSFIAWDFRTGHWVPEIYRALMGREPPLAIAPVAMRGRS